MRQCTTLKGECRFCRRLELPETPLVGVGDKGQALRLKHTSPLLRWPPVNVRYQQAGLYKRVVEP